MAHLTNKLLIVRVANRLFQSACFILLIINCFYLTVDYFTYGVIYQVAPYTPIVLDVPKFSLCLPLSSFFGDDKSFFDTREDFIADRTFNEFKEALPPTENVLTKCAYRDWNLDSMVKMTDSSRCNQFFRIKAFRLNGYFCYRFYPPDRQYTFYSIINTLNERRYLYHLTVNQPLNSGYKLCPMVHFSRYPIDDRTFDQELLVSLDSNESYSLSYAVYEIYSLPPPYQTQCRQAATPHQCFVDCMARYFASEGIAAINNNPDFDDESLPLLNTHAKYNNRTVFELFTLAASTCEKPCSGFNSCSLKLVKTVISTPSEGADKLSFSIETISEPITLTKTQAKFTLISFVYQIASLAGAWLGFSIYRSFAIVSSLYHRTPLQNTKKHLFKECKSLLKFSQRIERILHHRLWNPRAHGRKSMMDKPLAKSKKNKSNSTLFAFKFLSYAVKGMACVGLFIQLTNISQFYFQYAIRTELRFDLNPLVETPVIALCIRYTSMLYRPKLPPFNRTTYQDNFKLLNQAYTNLTMSAIFDKSWQAFDIMRACRWRRFGNETWINILHTQEECYQAFNITRFFLNRQVCYRFHFLDSISYNQLDHKLRLSDPGIFFSIILDNDLTRLGSLLVITFKSQDILPLESKDYAVEIHPNARKGSLFLASMYIAERNSLPAPYKTNCRSLISTSRCLRRCMTRLTINRLNRVPQSEVYAEDQIRKYVGQLKLINYNDLDTEESINTLKNLEDECDRRCNYPSCHSEVIKTLVTPAYRSNNLEIAIDAHAYPMLRTNDVPAFVLYDFYFLIVSTVTFWTALTILSLDPFPLIDRFIAFRRNNKQSKFFVLMKKNIRLIKHICVNSCKLLGIQMRKLPTRIHALTRGRAVTTRCHPSITFVKRLMKCKYLLHFMCSIGCTIHLHYSLSSYLQYPTMMNTQSSRETNESYPDFTICLSTYQLLCNNKSYEHNCVSRNVSSNEDFFPPVTIAEIFDHTPRAEELMVGCSYRGLQFSEDPLPLLNKRIYLEEQNTTLCNSLFNIEKVLLQGFVCFRYERKTVTPETRMEYLHHLTFPGSIFSVVLDSNILTSKFTLMVSDRSLQAYMSSVWAPNVQKLGPSTIMSISYIKYVRYVLRPPYSNDGFTDETLFACVHFCLLEHLKPLGFVDAGLYFQRENIRYVTTADRTQEIMQATIESFEDHCTRQCANRNMHNETKISACVTMVNEWKESSKINTTEFQVTQTEYPVITVIFSPKISFFELVITLGSILGIWYGFTAIHLDPSQHLSRRDRDFSTTDLTLTQKQLNHLTITLHEIHFYLAMFTHHRTRCSLLS